MTKTLNKSIFAKNRDSSSLVGPYRTGKSQLLCYCCRKNGKSQAKFDKNNFFIINRNNFTIFCKNKNMESLEFVQSANFEFIDLFKKSTKFLSLVDDSCEESFNSKAFVDIATAGTHRGLNIIYFRLNLSHQSKLGRDVKFQSTYIVLFQSPRHWMQVSTLSAQLGLGSDLVDWYRYATSKLYSHLLIDMLPPNIGQTLDPFIRNFLSLNA